MNEADRSECMLCKTLIPEDMYDSHVVQCRKLYENSFEVGYVPAEEKDSAYKLADKPEIMKLEMAGLANTMLQRSAKYPTKVVAEQCSRYIQQFSEHTEVIAAMNVLGKELPSVDSKMATIIYSCLYFCLRKRANDFAGVPLYMRNWPNVHVLLDSACNDNADAVDPRIVYMLDLTIILIAWNLGLRKQYMHECKDLLPFLYEKKAICRNISAWHFEINNAVRLLIYWLEEEEAMVKREEVKVKEEEDKKE